VKPEAIAEAAQLVDAAIVVDRRSARQEGDLPPALTLRGQLRLASGDREGARADLAEAVQRFDALPAPDEEGARAARQALARVPA
jgi:hypothetical protein